MIRIIKINRRYKSIGCFISCRQIDSLILHFQLFLFVFLELGLNKHSKLRVNFSGEKSVGLERDFQVFLKLVDFLFDENNLRISQALFTDLLLNETYLLS